MRDIPLQGTYFISFKPRHCSACGAVVILGVMCDRVDGKRPVCKVCAMTRGLRPGEWKWRDIIA